MRYLIIVFFVFVISCSKGGSADNNSSDVGGEQIVLESTGTVVDTRGSVVDGNDIKDANQPFGAMIYEHQNISTLPFQVNTSKPNYAFNTKFAYDNTKKVWSSVDNLKWPTGNVNAGLSFFTYFPYINGTLAEYGSGTLFQILSDSNDAGSPKFRYVAGDDVLTHKDILVGDPNTLLSKLSVPNAYAPLAFKFVHILSSIVFSREIEDISADNNPSPSFRFRITEVTISNLYNEAAFNAKTDTAKPTLITSEMTWRDYKPIEQDASFVLSSSNLKPASDEEGGQGSLALDTNHIVSLDNAVMFLPPQTVNNLKIVVKAEVMETITTTENGIPTSEIVTDELVIEKSLQNFVLEQGKRYNLAVIYKYSGPVKGQIDIIGTIVPWEQVQVVVPPYI